LWVSALRGHNLVASRRSHLCFRGVTDMVSEPRFVFISVSRVSGD
jgi:hypothetical protein